MSSNNTLPESVESALGVVALSDYPSVEPVLRFHISDLARRLAEAEAENGRFADMLESSVADWRKLYAEERAKRVRIQHILMDDVQSERQESDEHIKGLNTIIATQDKNIGDLKAHIQRIGVDHDDVEARAEAAEARVRELERDNAGRFEHVVKVEAERDALRERCEKLKAALVEIGESEDRICSYCEGEGNRYADGKAHYYSEHAPTIPCPECGGRGRLRDMDSEDMANVANAALAATEAKP